MGSKFNFWVDTALLFILAVASYFYDLSIWWLILILGLVIQILFIVRTKEEQKKIRLYRVCGIINLILLIVEVIYHYKFEESILWLVIMLTSIASRYFAVLSEKKE